MKGGIFEKREIMKNKNGKVGSGIIIAIVAIIAVVFAIYMFGNKQEIAQQGPATINSGAGCSVNPTVVMTSTNKLQAGTALNPANNHTEVNGIYKGTAIPSSFSKNDRIRILTTLAGYLSTIQDFTSSPLTCGANTVNAQMYAFANPTAKLFNANGILLSNAAAGLTSNESSSATSITQKLTLTEAAYKSSGQMLVVVDYSNKTEVDSSGITMSDSSVATVPSFYSPVNLTVASTQKAFLISTPLINNQAHDYYITYTPQSGQTIGGVKASVTVTIYGLQDAVDTTGAFLTNAWQDSVGTNKTAGSTTYAFAI
jgi:hypothetical protein